MFDGLNEKYDIVINDAFITRFEYDKKRIVLEKIWNALKDEGVYITTMRNDWNYGNAIVPNSAEDLLKRRYAVQKEKISIVKKQKLLHQGI